MRRQLSGQQKCFFIYILAAVAQNDMGAGDILRVEPGVVKTGCFAGQFIVLVVVFAYENLRAIGGSKAEGMGGLVVIFAFELFTQISAFYQFVVNFRDFPNTGRGQQGGLDTFQISNGGLAFLTLYL